MRERDHIPHVSHEENDVLMAPFNNQEIRSAIFQMENNKVPGLDGFSADFYHFLWEVVKTILLTFFQDFHDGRLPIHYLNFWVITLLPKKEAIKIEQYRPICLLNVSLQFSQK